MSQVEPDNTHQQQQTEDKQQQQQSAESSNTKDTSSTTDTPEESKPVHSCSGDGCDSPASLQCPTCVKYQGEPHYFCGQECFKKNWAVHSRIHPELRRRAEFKPPNIRYTGPLRPAYVSPRVRITEPIEKPDYADTGIPISEQTSKASRVAPVYTPEEIKGIRAACKLTRDALDYAASLLRPGITTEEIDSKMHKFVVERGGYPSPLNYRGFPKSLCTSINEVICHGIPDARPLEDGDIINLDVSVFLNGFHGDANETYTVGNVDYESKRLVKATYESLQAALDIVKPGTLFRDFGEAISLSVRKHGYGVVKSYCGHGIGHLFHCAPNIPHYARNKAIGSCKPGMIFTIEPMINHGTWQDTHWPDDWTAVTVDGKRSAQFEHTLLVTEDGYELLTGRTENSPPLWWEDPANAEDLQKYEEFIQSKSTKKIK